MYNAGIIFNEIVKEVAKQKIDLNQCTSYLQKATAKACIDGYCDIYTFLNRVNKYLFEYTVRECQYQTQYYYQ